MDIIVNEKQKDRYALFLEYSFMALNLSQQFDISSTFFVYS
jgi:hypothetical protein